MNTLKQFGWIFYYKLFHPSRPRQISTGHAKIRMQNSIQTMMRAFGYSCDGNGVCYALIKMWTSAVLTDDEDKFFKRIRFIEDLYFTLDLFARQKANYQEVFVAELQKKLRPINDKISGGIPFDCLSPQEQSLIETQSFLENAHIIQYSNQYYFLNEDREHKLFAKLFASRKLEQIGGAASLYNYCYVDPPKNHKEYLFQYFHDLNIMLGKCKDPFKIAVNIQNTDHNIGLRYLAPDKWLYVEPNGLPGYPVSTKMLNELLRKSMPNEGNKSFDFHMEIFAADNPARHAELAGFKRELAAFHDKYAVTPERLDPGLNFYTLLHHAAFYGHNDIISELAAMKTDLNHIEIHKHFALNSAASKNQLDTVKLLIKLGAIPDKLDGNDLTPLSWAAINNDTEMVQVLLEAGADINQLNSVGQSALHLAASCSNEEMIELLIAKGADIHLENSRGETALHMAALHDNLPALQVLISRGADINAENNHDCTPLIAAIKVDSYNAVKALLQAGANQAIESEVGTALSVAMEEKHERIVGLLRRN